MEKDAEHQETRSQNHVQPPAEIGGPPSQRLEKRKHKLHSQIPEPQGLIDVEGDQVGDENTYSIFPLNSPGGIAHSESEKVEVLNHSLNTQFQLVTDFSVPAVIEWLMWRSDLTS
jgi:hypothetical protein